MSTTLIRRLMDTVEAVELDDPDRDFVDSGVALLALAISRLDPAQREDVLRGIEFGALRQAVAQFPNAQPRNQWWH
jgi:hypothetical protein